MLKMLFILNTVRSFSVWIHALESSVQPGVTVHNGNFHFDLMGNV